MLGSVLYNVVFVLGCSFFAGTYGQQTPYERELITRGITRWQAEYTRKKTYSMRRSLKRQHSILVYRDLCILMRNVHSHASVRTKSS